MHEVQSSAVPQSLAEIVAGTPWRAVTDRLDQRRYVAAGDRAYVLGTTDGCFPPLGQKIAGLMGGIWAPPIKLLNGFWVALDDTWLPPATRFTSGAGYVQFDLPTTAGLRVRRTEFAPDGLPVVLVALSLQNPASVARTVALTLEVQSELLGSYPWDSSRPSAKAANRRDRAVVADDPGTLQFAEPGKPWVALVGAAQPALKRTTGDQFWGPLARIERAPLQELGKGTGGHLRWSLEVPGGTELTFWIAVAGGTDGAAAASAVHTYALAHAERLLQEKVWSRAKLLAHNQLELPEAALVAAFEWGKLNMADLRRTVTNAHVRDVQQGAATPPPVATLPVLRGVGDGFPDYVSFYGTGSGYIVYPLIAAGMWDAAMAHQRTLRDVSRLINGATGKVVHEILSDGSVYYGATGDPGNTNETAEFAIATDALWRWTGDVAFRDEMYDFIVDGLRYITTELDPDQTGWPEGGGIAERPGVGSQALDVACSTWQALRALEHMATGKADRSTARWARSKAEALEQRFDADWWLGDHGLYADSRCTAADVARPDKHAAGWSNVCRAPGQKLQQRIWTTVMPMKTMLAPTDCAHVALDRLESPDFTDPDGNLFLVGAGGGPDEQAQRTSWTVATGTMALAEANYGRLAEHQAMRYMRAVAASLDLEQPGALPEVVPSPDYNAFGDLRERYMLMQAWASFGIGWTAMHNLLGIRPEMPEHALAVIPHLPPAWSELGARNVRIGDGTVTVAVARDQLQYRVTVFAPPSWTLVLGHTLPVGSDVASVTLDDRPVAYTCTETTRGSEVTVTTTSDAPRTLVVLRR